jgi:hypothetical protein
MDIQRDIYCNKLLDLFNRDTQFRRIALNNPKIKEAEYTPTSLGVVLYQAVEQDKVFYNFAEYCLNENR